MRKTMVKKSLQLVQLILLYTGHIQNILKPLFDLTKIKARYYLFTDLTWALSYTNCPIYGLQFVSRLSKNYHVDIFHAHLISITLNLYTVLGVVVGGRERIVFGHYVFSKVKCEGQYILVFRPYIWIYLQDKSHILVYLIYSIGSLFMDKMAEKVKK